MHPMHAALQICRHSFLFPWVLESWIKTGSTISNLPRQSGGMQSQGYHEVETLQPSSLKRHQRPRNSVPFCKHCSFIWLIWDREDHSTMNYRPWDAPSLAFGGIQEQPQEGSMPILCSSFCPFSSTLPPVSHLIGVLVFIYLHLWGEWMVLFTVRNITRLDQGGGVANVGCVWAGGRALSRDS